MNKRIHDMRAKIKTIEDMLGSLSAPMHELALEEQKNLQFELDMVQRNVTKTADNQFAVEHAKEKFSYA